MEQHLCGRRQTRGQSLESVSQLNLKMVKLRTEALTGEGWPDKMDLF